MSITDELREYANTRISPNKGMLTAIADRIDAEHEDVVRKKAARMLTKTSEYMNDDDLAEIGLVRLPKDADGEYVRIGDVMAYEDNTKPMQVVALVPPVVFVTEEGPRYADMCRHYKPPTTEDMLREFMYAILNQKPEFREENIAEYASKLQLKENIAKL